MPARSIMFMKSDKEAPTLKNVTALLEEKLGEGNYAYPAELENAIYRLREFSREGEDFFARKSTIDLDKLITSGLVDVDLSGLPDERFRALAGLFILQTLKEKMRFEGWSANKGLKAIVVLDEAWKIASDERSDAITIIREGRKYQFGLIVASQNPTDINEAIFSNVGTSIILRIRFEKFLDYLQGSLGFTAFMRDEISRFGVGQAAIDLSFQTSVRFPSVFIIEHIAGEMPLNVYGITLGDILQESELGDTNIKKDYYLKKMDITAKLVRTNASTDMINSIIADMDRANRAVDIKGLVIILTKNNISREAIIQFLREIGVPDNIISRVFIYTR